MKNKYSREFIKEERKGYIFVLPALIFMLAFVGYPIIYNFILSFHDVNVMTFSQAVKPFVGIENYIEVFKDPVMSISIWNTLIFTIGSISIQFIIGLGLALLFNLKFKLSKPLRGLMVVSYLVPMTVTALLFKFMYSTGGGIINELLMKVNLISQPIGWIIDSKTSMLSVILTNSWVGIPFNMLLLTTGLSNISYNLYEAAKVDGANVFQRFFKITLPSLRPAILSVLVLGFIYTFKVFDLVFVMTNGGPVNSTELMSTFAYKLSFTQFSFSKGATVANVLFAILFCVSLGYLKLIKEDEVIG
ncbi:sugar ABC transporter permease [Clostridium chromiireducens]|uniref:Sugar ABC transporter permease n=1 Tax=Clostridium chromiireducens TaxID=225345 RepID=A0A399IK75_9CLOT|nr:sugar ABC transporter permease [Clostridium chromiireducens]RII32907.1 sugar ABC transporter permease [Clostridium chromiireducens]